MIESNFLITSQISNNTLHVSTQESSSFFIKKKNNNNLQFGGKVWSERFKTKNYEFILFCIRYL